MTRRGERFTDDEIARIRKLAGERRTDEEIGLLLGRGMSSIRQIRARLGIEAGGGTYDPAPPVNPELAKRIRELAGKGWSDERMGRSLRRTRTQIMRLRKRLGIDSGNPNMGHKAHIAGPQIVAEARRAAHIQTLRERRAMRRAIENV